MLQLIGSVFLCLQAVKDQLQDRADGGGSLSPLVGMDRSRGGSLMERVETATPGQARPNGAARTRPQNGFWSLMGVGHPGSGTGGDFPNTPPIRRGCRGAGKGGQLLKALESSKGIEVGREIDGRECNRGWNM